MARFRAVRRNNGFTIIEVLTASAITLGLFGILILTYFQSQTAVGHTVDKIEAVQTARHLVDKLTPVVSVAVSTSELGEQAVRVHVPSGDYNPLLNDPTWLDFTSTEDLFADDYSTKKRDFYRKNELLTYDYRVEYEPVNQRVVLLRMDLNGAGVRVPDGRFQPKLIASNIAGLLFVPSLSNSSVIEVRMRIQQKVSVREAGEVRVVETTASLHVPSESL